jgi:hypothetical protein
MRPGLSRAIPFAIVGFLGGALLVIILRALQGLTPLWAFGPGIVVASFTTAFAFVWGMGGFDPRMSVHGEEAEHAHDEEEVPDKPTGYLTEAIWQLTTILLVALLVLFAVAWFPGGFTLRTTEVPDASLTSVGFVNMNVFGVEFEGVSQLVLFIAFIMIMMVSLGVVAGGIGFAMYALSGGIANAAATKFTPFGGQLFEYPTGEDAPKPSIPLPLTIAAFAGITIVVFIVMMQFIMPVVTGPNVLGVVIPFRNDAIILFSLAAGLGAAAAIIKPRFWLMPLAVYAALVCLLYPIFYHVAIGLVIPSPEALRVIVSLVNALLIPLLIIRPLWLLKVTGVLTRVGAWTGQFVEKMFTR